MSRREMEEKILVALRKKMEQMNEYDVHCKEEADKCFAEAKELEANGNLGMWGSDGKIHEAKWHLSFQYHGYAFLTDWKNVISGVMFGRVYHEWHSAQAGLRKGEGHGAYITSELSDDECIVINKVFDGLVKHGYLRLSKSQKMATFKG